MQRRDPASWLERFRTACSLRCGRDQRRRTGPSRHSSFAMTSVNREYPIVTIAPAGVISGTVEACS
jgi:hypothetical protein